ncbi:uncharacterized [Tachysurus ichikawai]
MILTNPLNEKQSRRKSAHSLGLPRRFSCTLHVSNPYSNETGSCDHTQKVCILSVAVWVCVDSAAYKREQSRKSQGADDTMTKRTALKHCALTHPELTNIRTGLK